jgi:AbrB family looped-hinge helix DNA binding protein
MKKVKPMTFYTNLTQKGQLTIPKELRQLIGAQPKDRMQLTASDREIRIRRVGKIREIAGMFPAVPGKSWKTGREAMEKEYERF